MEKTNVCGCLSCFSHSNFSYYCRKFPLFSANAIYRRRGRAPPLIEAHIFKFIFKMNISQQYFGNKNSMHIKYLLRNHTFLQVKFIKLALLKTILYWYSKGVHKDDRRTIQEEDQSDLRKLFSTLEVVKVSNNIDGRNSWTMKFLWKL